MADSTPESRQIRFLLINLALILVCIAGLVLAIFATGYLSSRGQAARTPASASPRPSLIPSFTSTLTLTPTASRTLRPTLTASLTHTPTLTQPAGPTATQPGLPTLTPARPQSLSSVYDLNPCSPDQADYLARLMQDYPQSLPSKTDLKAFASAHRFAILALREALLRFPSAPQAEDWRWRLAYDLAVTGNTQAGDEFGSLIMDGLNSGAVDLPHLSAWFQEHDPRLALYIVQTTPPPGYLASYLVEVRSQGSAFIRVLQSSSGFLAQPLLSGFDFIHRTQAGWIVTDLDGNPQNGEEIAIYFSTPPGQFQLTPPRVFNLSSETPLEMPFLPEQGLFDVGMDYTNYWAAAANASGSHDLVFKSSVFPACPTLIQRVYRWNGSYFALQSASFKVEPSLLPLGFCDLIAQHAASVWGPQAAVPILDALLPQWPPAQDPQGKPYPPDAADEWKFRLAVQSALAGDLVNARRYLQWIVQEPAVPASTWIQPALAFQKTLRSPEDIYRACVQTPECDPSWAIYPLVSGLPEGADALGTLQARGVAVRASGYFDFDGDDQPERWFSVRHRPLEALELWILANYPGGIQPMRVGTIETNQPELTYLDKAFIEDAAASPLPVVFVNGKLALRMPRLPDTLQPYLVSVPLRKEYPNKFFDAVQKAQDDLFNDLPAMIVERNLQDLQTYPGLLCRATWSCDEYYYLLGLSSELAGDVRQAVSAYHRLWLDYSKSPYTILARLKLKGQPYLSPTPSPTITPTGTPIPTFTITGTPPSATPSPSSTPTPSGTQRTLTPTLTGTPSTATPTNTGTPATATLTPSPTETQTPSPTPVTPYP